MAEPMRIAELIAAQLAVTLTTESPRNVAAALLLLVSREMIVLRIRQTNGGRMAVAPAGLIAECSEIGEIVYDALAEKLDATMEVIQAGGASGNQTVVRPNSSGTAGST